MNLRARLCVDCVHTLITETTHFQSITMATPLKQEEENFLRLVRIVFRDVQPKLRQLFKSQFTTKYGMPYADDSASGSFFLYNILPQNRCRDAKVMNAIRHGDTASFDCTTLFYCILNSKALLLPPMRRRNAIVPPLNTSEAVDRLREQRNLLAHSSSDEMSQQEFTARRNELTTIYFDLGWPVADLQKYATDPLETTECVSLRRDLLKERRIEQRLRGLEGRFAYEKNSFFDRL